MSTSLVHMGVEESLQKLGGDWRGLGWLPEVSSEKRFVKRSSVGGLEQ